MNRPTESVISVSPDDLKYIGTPGGEEWRETSKNSEKTEEKPDLFKPHEPLTEDMTIPVWKPEPKPEEEKERAIISENKTEDQPEKAEPVYVPESLEEIPVVNNHEDFPFTETKLPRFLFRKI